MRRRPVPLDTERLMVVLRAERGCADVVERWQADNRLSWRWMCTIWRSVMGCTVYLRPFSLPVITGRWAMGR